MNTTHKSDSQHQDERKPRAPQQEDHKQHEKHGQPRQPDRQDHDHGGGQKK